MAKTQAEKDAYKKKIAETYKNRVQSDFSETAYTKASDSEKKTYDAQSKESASGTISEAAKIGVKEGFDSTVNAAGNHTQFDTVNQIGGKELVKSEYEAGNVNYDTQATSEYAQSLYEKGKLTTEERDIWQERLNAEKQQTALAVQQLESNNKNHLDLAYKAEESIADANTENADKFESIEEKMRAENTPVISAENSIQNISENTLTQPLPEEEGQNIQQSTEISQAQQQAENRNQVDQIIQNSLSETSEEYKNLSPAEKSLLSLEKAQMQDENFANNQVAIREIAQIREVVAVENQYAEKYAQQLKTEYETEALDIQTAGERALASYNRQEEELREDKAETMQNMKEKGSKLAGFLKASLMAQGLNPSTGSYGMSLYVQKNNDFLKTVASVSQEYDRELRTIDTNRTNAITDFTSELRRAGDQYNRDTLTLTYENEKVRSNAKFKEWETTDEANKLNTDNRISFAKSLVKAEMQRDEAIETAAIETRKKLQEEAERYSTATGMVYRVDEGGDIEVAKNSRGEPLMNWAREKAEMTAKGKIFDIPARSTNFEAWKVEAEFSARTLYESGVYTFREYSDVKEEIADLEANELYEISQISGTTASTGTEGNSSTVSTPTNDTEKPDGMTTAEWEEVGKNTVVIGADGTAQEGQFKDKKSQALFNIFGQNTGGGAPRGDTKKENISPDNNNGYVSALDALNARVGK